MYVALIADRRRAEFQIPNQLGRFYSVNRYTHFDDICDPESAAILQVGTIGCHLYENRVAAGPTAAGDARARLFLATPRLRVRRPPPHVEHDGACTRE